jgi:aspartyl-tRNA(Asn)/glutamyl-tRNA(Gln) amidotransferase subunit A
MMEDMLRLGLTELLTEIEQRRISPVELMRTVIDRVEATHPDLNAVVAVRDVEGLLADAAAAEERVMANDARPLESIPFFEFDKMVTWLVGYES